MLTRIQAVTATVLFVLMAFSISVCAPVQSFLLHQTTTLQRCSASRAPPLQYITTTSRYKTQLQAKRTKKKAKARSNIICINRQARLNYEIIETMEAGVALKGTEVKSIRDGKMNLGDGYVRPTKDGRSCLLYNVHIGKHDMSGEYFQLTSFF